MLSVWSLRKQESSTGATNLISEQTGVSLSITGEMREGNNLLGDVDVTFFLAQVWPDAKQYY